LEACRGRCKVSVFFWAIGLPGLRCLMPVFRVGTVDEVKHPKILNELDRSSKTICYSSHGDVLPDWNGKMINPAASFDNTATQNETGFDDRRKSSLGSSPVGERRQFSPSYDSLSDDAKELGKAVDQYKLLNRRRYIDYEELLAVIQSLGYSR